MKPFNKYTTKNAIVASLIFAAAVLNFLTLLFTVVRGSYRILAGTQSYYSNGFTLAFSGYPIQIEGCGDWLRVWSVFHFSTSVLIILLLVLRAAVKPGKPFGKLGVFAVVTSLLSSLVYLINGFVAHAEAAKFALLYHTSFTAAYIPFIFILLLTVAISAVKMKMPEDFEF